MEEKKLTEKESLELIAEMIRNTKSKLELGDGNILLLWGYLSVGAAATVYLAGMLTHSVYCNWLWLLIPVIGYPAMKYLDRRKSSERSASTYVDKISAGIWEMVGGLSFAGMALCVGFMLFGYNVWILMFIYAFVIVGFGAAVQGVVIREDSLIFGGIFSILAGGFIVCCVKAGILLLQVWALPLYILCFILMTIVPGHIINHKAKRQCQKN
ncbi:MAG: hypothetical protein K2I47_04470 [Odoribacter sp.]|nr:hypothetical protein [Odoribacter sp.]